MDPDCPGPVFEVNGNITVHQPLSEQDLNAARNGKLLKKLRDIKALCPGTCLKFNQSLKVIEISGASDDVHMAQEKVQECTGPTKSISLAVWCELLRTLWSPRPDPSPHILSGPCRPSPPTGEIVWHTPCYCMGKYSVAESRGDVH